MSPLKVYLHNKKRFSTEHLGRSVMHAIYFLSFYFFVSVSGNPAGRGPAVDCIYICNPQNGLQFSCPLRCPEYKQLLGTSNKSPENHSPITAVVASLVSVIVVAVALGVILYKFRERICNGSKLNNLCKKFGYPVEATLAENNSSAKFAGKTDEHEIESLSSGNRTL